MPVRAPSLAISVESWFLRNQRDLPWRTGYDPYLVWVSEVMLQQTRMEVVLRYFRPFIERFPSLDALAAASEDQVLTLWSGLGYYRRARMLAAGAREVVTRFGGVIPQDVVALQSIPGIGRYTAGAIASIAFGLQAPIVDGNVARVLARVFAITEPVGSPRLMAAAWQRATTLVEASGDPRSFNQGLMEIGALVCTPQKPDCASCPLRRPCAARATDRVDLFPLPKTKRVARKMTVPLYLIGDGTGRFLMRRESGALMTSMFHLPHGSTDLLPGTLDGVIERERVGSFRHTITTRNVEFVVHRATLLDRIADGDGEYAWVHPADLRDLPHPSYVEKAMRLTVTG